MFNVDPSPKFRYWLETETRPVPNERLRTLSLLLSERAFANGDLTRVEYDGDRVGDSDVDALESRTRRLRETDPDVPVLSTADVIPFIAERATECTVDIQLGRLPGYRQLASDSTFESDGRVGRLVEHCEPAPVADRLARYLNELRGGSVDPADLVLRTRVSKPLEGISNAHAPRQHWSGAMTMEWNARPARIFDTSSTTKKTPGIACAFPSRRTGI